MLEINTKKSAPEIPREPLFAIDGTTYTIPERFHPTDMLMYLHILTTGGGDAAGKWALHYALGDDGFWALFDAGGAVDEHQLKAMIDCVTGRLLGMSSPVPGPKAEPESDPAPETDSTEEPPDEVVWPESESGAPDQE